MPLCLTLNVFIAKLTVNNVPPVLGGVQKYVKYKFKDENKMRYIKSFSENLENKSDIFLNAVNKNEINEAPDRLMKLIYTAAECMK